MVDGTRISWTLAGTYLTSGAATGPQYEAVPGATVTVTNQRTGEDHEVTVDEDGSYSVDLGDTTNYPSGYAIGDEVLIQLTLDDTTRSWTRRIAGSEIAQDLHFTHGTYLGTLRKARLVQVDTSTGRSGSSITIRDSTTKDVLSVDKNGDTVATTDWTFTLPNTLTLTTPFSASDVIEITRANGLGIQDAKDAIVAEGDSQVRNSVARYYPSPLPDRVPELQDISESLAAAVLRDMLYGGGDKPDSIALALRKYARDRLKELYDGTRNLTDYAGAFITPTIKTAAAPSSSGSPATRTFSRFSETRRTL